MMAVETYLREETGWRSFLSGVLLDDPPYRGKWSQLNHVALYEPSLPTVAHGMELDETNTGPEAAGYTLTDFVGADTIVVTADDTVYEGLRFPNTVFVLEGDNITFRGCEFLHNSPGFFAIRVNGRNTKFEDCRFRPISDTIPVSMENSYQQGIKAFSSAVGLTVRRSEFWGFGNAIEFEPNNSTLLHPVLVEECWFHDAADQENNVYHHDGILSSYAAAYVQVHRCKIVSGGNTNAIAFQAFPGEGWHHIQVTDSDLGGFGYTVNMGDESIGHDITFTGNRFNTSIPAGYGPFKSHWTLFTGTNVWQNNTWDTGGYWWPTDVNTNPNHATDWVEE